MKSIKSYKRGSYILIEYITEIFTIATVRTALRRVLTEVPVSLLTFRRLIPFRKSRSSCGIFHLHYVGGFVVAGFSAHTTAGIYVIDIPALHAFSDCTTLHSRHFGKYRTIN